MSTFSEIFGFEELDLSKFKEEIRSASKEVSQLEAQAGETSASFGKLSKDASNINLTAPISNFKSLKEEMSTMIGAKGFNSSEINKIFDEFGKNIGAQKKFVAELKKELQGLSGEDFKELNGYIEQLEKSFKDVEKQSKSTKQEFRELNKQGGELNKSQLAQAGKLKDAIADQQQQIRILASDTKALDFGVEAITTAANGYQVLAGAMQLFGIENEDAMQAMAKLQAIMAITTGLREIQNALLAEGTLLTVGNSTATAFATTAQTLYASAVTLSSTAMGKFKLAMLGTGIGVLVVALGFAIAKWKEYSEATERANENLKKQKQFNDDVAESSTKEITRLSILKSAINDETLSRDKRLRAVQNLQKEFPTYFAGLNQEAILAGKVGDAYDLTTQAILRKARANVAQKELEKIIEEELKAELNAVNARKEAEKKDVGLNPSQIKVIADQKKIFETTGTVIKEGFQKRKDFLLKTINEGTDFEVKTEKIKAQKVTKAGTDKRLELLQKAKEKELELQKQHDDLLNSLLNESNEEIFKNNVDASKNRLSLVVDEYAKQRSEIERSFDTQSQILLDKTTELQSKLRLQLTDPRTKASDKAEIQATIDNIKLSYKTLQTALEDERAIKLANAGFDHFNNTLKELRDNADLLGIQLETSHLTEILNLNQTFKNGEVSFEDYQKKLTDLNEQYSKKRLQDTKESLLKELYEINNKLLDGGLTDEQNKSLINQKNKLKNEIAKVDVEANAVTDKTDKHNLELKQIGEKIDMYKTLSDTALNALKQIEDAEIKALDKKIAREEKKLEKAKALAEKGNYSILEIEQQKLTALENKREKAARRQLQIDSALQASAILTAVASATTKIREGGSANVISGIATIIGALASGYALVKANQDNQPAFYDGTDGISRHDFRSGTDNVSHGGAGKDDVHARVNYGEGIIQAHLNTKYQPLVKAIRRDDINGIKNFTFKQLPSAPIINVDNGISKKDINELKEAISSIAMNVNLDKYGFLASLSTMSMKLNKLSNA